MLVLAGGAGDLPLLLRHVKSMNFTSVRSMYFLGRGLGAGERTVSDLLSASTAVLHQLEGRGK